MRGRKPKPEGLSTRRPRRREGGPVAKLPPCPAHLQGEARKEWFRIGHQLVSYGLMTEVDKAALAAYCQAWARWVEAEEQVGKFGTVIKSPNGFPVQSPYLPIANRAMEQMMRLLVEFGMSPSSRSRVTVQPQPPEPARGAVEPPEPAEDPRRLLRAVQ